MSVNNAVKSGSGRDTKGPHHRGLAAKFIERVRLIVIPVMIAATSGWILYLMKRYPRMIEALSNIAADPRGARVASELTAAFASIIATTVTGQSRRSKNLSTPSIFDAHDESDFEVS